MRKCLGKAEQRFCIFQIDRIVAPTNMIKSRKKIINTCLVALIRYVLDDAPLSEKKDGVLGRTRDRDS